MSRFKLFPLFFLVVVLFFFYAVYLNVRPFVERKLKGYYIVEQIEIEGLKKKTPKEILKVIQKKGQEFSLLTFNEKKYRKKIEESFNDINVVEFIKVYPHTLHIILNEKEPLFLVKLSNYFFGIDNKGGIIIYNDKRDILSFDKVIINMDISSRLQKEILKLNKQEKNIFFKENIYLKQLINSFLYFPMEERDWIQQISNIDLNRRILYTRDGFQIKLENFSIDNLRKARYCYVYLVTNKMSSVKIYISEDFIKYAKNNQRD